jgi:hypothetical protein
MSTEWICGVTGRKRLFQAFCFVAGLMTLAAPRPTVAQMVRSEGDSGAASPSPDSEAEVPPEPRRWWALLIAAENYDSKTTGLTKLEYCNRDMAALRNDWLLAAGVPAEQIVFLHDRAAPEQRPTRANIERELRTITARLTSRDVFLLGAAMHGGQVGEQSHLCPLDFSLKSAEAKHPPEEAGLISLSDVFDRVAHCQAAFKLLIVDACRESLKQASPAVRRRQAALVASSSPPSII